MDAKPEDTRDEFPPVDEPALPAVTPPATSFFVQLFLLPAAIVFGIMLVWFLFGKLAGGERSPEEYVEIICSTRGDRWKAAHDLSQILRNDSAHTRDEALAMRLATELDRSLDSQSTVEQKKLTEYLCGAVGSFQMPLGVPALRKAAAAKQDPSVRRAALIAIMNLSDRTGGKMDDPNLVPELLATLRDESEEFRGLAAMTLGLIGTDPCRTGLRAAVNDPSARVRYDAANALARLGDPTAFPTLAEMLDVAGLRQRFAVREADGQTAFDRELVEVSVLTALQSISKLHAAGAPVPEDVKSSLAKLVESSEGILRSEARNVQLKLSK